MKTTISARNFDFVMMMDAILISLACLLVILAYREINDAPVRHARDMAHAIIAVADDRFNSTEDFELRTDNDGRDLLDRKVEKASRTVRTINPNATSSVYATHPLYAETSLDPDEFRVMALEQFNAGESEMLERIEHTAAGAVVRAAMPLIATRDCEQCGVLGLEPFKRGDVIGVREFAIPVGDQQAQAMKKLLYACGLMASSLMVFLGFIIPMYKRNRAERAQIHDRATDLEKQAITDALTGLFNRRYFEQALDAYLAEFNEREAPLGLLVFDLDHFKQVNDNHGHDAGDLVLKEVALRLGAITRENDVVARIGGEEFAVITPYANHEQLLGVAERYRKSISDLKIDIGDIILKPTISIGVATNGDPGMTAQDMFKSADGKLYEAKRNGRNRVAA